MTGRRAVKPGPGAIIERAVKAVAFVEQRRAFTAFDLADELGIVPKCARQYIAALSLHLPIVELRPARNRGGAMLPALYGLRRK